MLSRKMLPAGLLVTVALFAASAAGASVGGKCSSSTKSAKGGAVVFEGRVPQNFKLTDFDADNDLYNSDFAKGADLKFSEIIKFPDVEASRFDGTANKPFEITINDKSIFNNQTGFRRAGLLFKKNSGKDDDPSIVGVKAIHWSVRMDANKPLNLSHEYLLVFHEKADFSGNQFNFLAGELIAGVPKGANANDKNTYKILDSSNTQIFSTPILKDKWQNFAITMDFSLNTLQVFSSTGKDPLVAAGDPVKNDNSGGGQFQMAILKKPTDAKDVTKDGFQEANLDEGLIYGGIFLEESAGGRVSL